MKVSKYRLIILLAGVMMLPMPLSYMGVGVVSIAIAASQNINMNGNVNADCKFATSAPILNFGTYDPVGANAASPDNSSTSFSIACTNKSAVTLGLNFGTHASGSQARMTNGSSFLNYALYKDAGRATPWTNSGGGLVNYTGAGQNKFDSFVIYGQVPAAQDISIGSYTDTVTITATF